MPYSPIKLPTFTQLLEPEGIAPAQDFEDSGRLICNQLPSMELRSKIRFIIGEIVRFQVRADDEVRRLMKYWRAELSPQIDSNEEDLLFLVSKTMKSSLISLLKRQLSDWSIICLPVP